MWEFDVDVSTGVVVVDSFYKETTNGFLYRKYLKCRELEKVIEDVCMDIIEKRDEPFFYRTDFEDFEPSDNYPEGSVFIRITTNHYSYWVKYEGYSLVFGPHRFIEDAKDVMKSFYRKTVRKDDISKMIFVNAMERVFRKEGVEWK